MVRRRPGLRASALWAASACRTTTPVSSRPAPVRLAIGYAGPGRISGIGARALGYLITSERLVQFRRDGRVEPSLAERWEQSADGLTWRFFLRPNLTFHDGKPIDAEVSARHVRACRVAGCRDIASVETDGPRTVVVRMRRPSALLLDSLNDVAIYSDEANEMSAGPFREVPNAPGAEASRTRATPTPSKRSRNSIAAIRPSIASTSSCSRTRATPGRR